MNKKNRVEIPNEIAADILFRSDRRCCVCRERKPIQIHHIDENPGNSSEDNLAVLCFDCHRDTQIRGGFDRKLDAAQIRRYRDDWLIRIANKREREHGPLGSELISHWIKPVKYVQIKENSEEHSFSIEAEYPQFETGTPRLSQELNDRITQFMTTAIDDFRSGAMATSQEKSRLREELAGTSWDSLSIAHKIWLMTPRFLSIEFVFQIYGAGALHPNSATRTLNFRLQPLHEMFLRNLFNPATNYLKALSDYCIDEIHRLQPERWYDPVQRAEELKLRKDNWVCSGAAPVTKNFEHFVLANEGITVFFDPYRVGSYAEGRYEIFVPFTALEPFLDDEFAKVKP